MNKEEYNELIEELTDHRRKIANQKREDYTKGSEDVFANFKNVAENVGLEPLQVWLVYANKHWDAICNYVKTDGQSESEPIKERISDLLVYLEIGWGLISENQPWSQSGFHEKYEKCKCEMPDLNVPSYCQSPETCGEINCTCSTGRSSGI